MNSKQWGHIDRWTLSKEGNNWYITAPGSYLTYRVSPTSAEALAAFTKGDPNV